jgi:hypothetical protein
MGNFATYLKVNYYETKYYWFTSTRDGKNSSGVECFVVKFSSVLPNVERDALEY